MKPRPGDISLSTRVGIMTLTSLLCLASLASCAPAPASAKPAIVTQAPAVTPLPAATRPPTGTPFAPIPTQTSTPSPSPTPTSTPDLSACLEAGGRIEIGQPLAYKGLPQGLSFRVYTPPCYAEQPERRFPVLYLIHGQSFNDDQWDRLGADETANRLIAAGEAPPFLIVMPRDRVWSDPDADRFGLALVDVLVPWIDANYRTLPDREHRFIGGLSRGGAWALHLGLRHWRLFGAFEENSGVIFGSDAPHILEWIKAIPPGSLPKIYLDDGEGDRYLFSMKQLRGMLDQAGVPYTWVLQPGYHNEAYWGAHVEDYLRWFTKQWSVESDP